MRKWIGMTVALVAMGVMAAEVNVQQAAKEKRALVLELLQITQTRQQAQSMFNIMIQSMPFDVQDVMKEALSVDDMVREIVPVYEKHLDTEDLRSIIGFYRTPAGQRLVQKQPQIVNDAMVVMKVFVEKKLQQVLKNEREAK